MNNNLINAMNESAKIKALSIALEELFIKASQSAKQTDRENVHQLIIVLQDQTNRLIDSLETIELNVAIAEDYNIIEK